MKLLNVNVNLRQTNVFYSAGFTFKIEENPLRSYPFLFDYLIVNLVKSAIREKKGVTDFFITIESVIVHVENDRRKSIKRSFHEYGRENAQVTYIAD